MKKIIIALFFIFFAAILFFIVKSATNIFKDANKPNSAQDQAYTDYWKKHDKKVGSRFIVDTVSYKVSQFKYKTKTDTTTLMVDVEINNKTNHPKYITDSAFSLSGGAYGKIFYPKLLPFSIAENTMQTVQLVYCLPENLLPSVLYYLNINSKKDSAQNGMITLYENYREGG